MGKDKMIFQRIEKKYFIPAYKLVDVLNSLKSYMTPDKYADYKLYNLYFDTDDYSLIRNSIEKPIYKEKLRMRSYGIADDNDDIFLEIKKKYDGVVYKRRIKLKYSDAIDYIGGNISPPCGNTQILSEISYFLNKYECSPKVFLSYERIAYKGISDPGLRITFDTNIKCRNTLLSLSDGDFGTVLLDSKIGYIMEIKAPLAYPIWLCGILEKSLLYPSGYSKYGSAYINMLQNKGVYLCSKV